MDNFERNATELPPYLRWRPGPIGDPIDMEFALQDVQESVRSEVLAARLETLANVHRSIADGATKIADIVRRGQQGG